MDHIGIDVHKRESQIYILAEGGSRLEEVIERLPVTQRLALTMRKLHDLEYEAIAPSLDCSTERARAYVLRALRTIRRELDRLAPGKPV